MKGSRRIRKRAWRQARNRRSKTWFRRKIDGGHWCATTR